MNPYHNSFRQIKGIRRFVRPSPFEKPSIMNGYRSKVFAWPHEVISETRLDKGKGWGLL